MKVFYNPKQSVTKNDSFSPSASKPGKFVDVLLESALDAEITSFAQASIADLMRVHDKQFVRDLLTCRAPNGFGNKSKLVAKSLRWLSGSAMASCLYSLESGLSSFAVVAGAHHAGHDFTGGFCTINHIMVGVSAALSAGSGRVGVLDLDAHRGNGTEDIINELKLRDRVLHYTVGAEGLSSCAQAKAWLGRLREIVYTFEGCSLLIYQAGADMHVKDKLCNGYLTTSEMRTSDRMVYEVSRALGIPVVTILGGGYQWDKQKTITPVIKLHVNTFQECINANK